MLKGEEARTEENCLPPIHSICYSENRVVPREKEITEIIAEDILFDDGGQQTTAQQSQALRKRNIRANTGIVATFSERKVSVMRGTRRRRE